ncbi:uncharacterized protein LOC130644563 [Hydractinia symbiolongicarpus]|uniref:uncharacterized protein LOC130644563 n=1 Tax=Hydractinia symbiolongicarpus TaxID=13093 RepID=UPI0025504200|nr:uncharacterized protein LOC130644563 [Hydractinia symbiolongicarpus]
MITHEAQSSCVSDSEQSCDSVVLRKSTRKRKPPERFQYTSFFTTAVVPEGKRKSVGKRQSVVTTAVVPEVAETEVPKINVAKTDVPKIKGKRKSVVAETEVPKIKVAKTEVPKIKGKRKSVGKRQSVVTTAVVPEVTTAVVPEVDEQIMLPPSGRENNMSLAEILRERSKNSTYLDILPGRIGKELTHEMKLVDQQTDNKPMFNVQNNSEFETTDIIDDSFIDAASCEKQPYKPLYGKKTMAKELSHLSMAAWVSPALVTPKGTLGHIYLMEYGEKGFLYAQKDISFYAIDGDVRINLSEKVFIDLEKGDCFHVPKGYAYKLDNVSNGSRTVLFCRYE